MLRLDAYLQHILMVRQVRRQKSTVLHPERLYAVELCGRDRLIPVGSDVEPAVHHINTAMADMAAFRSPSIPMAGSTGLVLVAPQQRKPRQSLLAHPAARVT